MSALPALAPATQSGLVARLSDISALLPPTVGGAGVYEWLRVPLAGEPLYLRLAEALWRLDVRHLLLSDSAPAQVLLKLLARRPAFGFVVGCSARLDPTCPPDFDLSAPKLLGGNFATPQAVREHAIRALDAPPTHWSRVWRIKGLVHLGAGSHVSRRAEVGGNAVAVGKDSFVGPRARLENGVVIGANCYVAADAHLSGVVLLDGATVDPHESLTNVIRDADGVDHG